MNGSELAAIVIAGWRGEAIGRMPEKTPAARGTRLVDALIVWITPGRPLEPGPPASST